MPVDYSDTIIRDAQDWVASVDSVSEQTWSAELENFDDASFYQTWSYGAVSWGQSQLSHLILQRRGQTVAMAQLRILRVPLLGRGIAYLRWGPMWRRKGEPANPAVLLEILRALQREYVQRRKLLLRIIPNLFSGDEFELSWSSALADLGLAPAPRPSHYRTFILDLSPSLEQLRKNLDQKWRNQLNRAEKNDLVIAEGTSLELYATFKGIYRELMDRKAFETTVDVGEFERMQEQLPPSQKLHILIASKNGTPVSALVGSTVGETGIYLLGATSNEGMQHKGSYLLQWRMIQRLKELGCGFYDLGGINPERNPGVYHFKSGFSAQDKIQAGEFECSGSWISSAVVALAEYRRRKRRRLPAGPIQPSLGQPGRP